MTAPVPKKERLEAAERRFDRAQDRWVESGQYTDYIEYMVAGQAVSDILNEPEDG